MKISSTFYIIAKIIFIIVAIYLFLNPEVFVTKGYQLSVDGVVICRGISLICAINLASNLLDNIYNWKDFWYNRKIVLGFIWSGVIARVTPFLLLKTGSIINRADRSIIYFYQRDFFRAKQKTYKHLLIGLSLYYLFLGFSIAAWAAASFAIGTLNGEHDT